MIKLFTLGLCLISGAQCQLLRDEDRIPVHGRPRRLYAGIPLENQAEDQQTQYYKSSPRRSENVPVQASYRLAQEENVPEDYYQPQQPASEQAENYPSQFTYRDYERVVKNNNLIRLKKKLQQQQQYLKEVPPTTSTVYQQRPPNYLRFVHQPIIRRPESESEETVKTSLKQPPPPYRYVLQTDLQPKLYAQSPYHQYDSQEIATKPPLQKHTPFNLVAYQNALLAQQKLMAESQEDAVPKSSIYVVQNIEKPKQPLKAAKTRVVEQPLIQTPVQTLDYYSAQQTQIQEPAPARYQKPVQTVAQEEVAYVNEDLAAYQDQEQQQPKPKSRPVIRGKLPKVAEQYQKEYKYQPRPAQEDAYVDYPTRVGQHQEYQHHYARVRRPVRPQKLPKYAAPLDQPEPSPYNRQQLRPAIAEDGHGDVEGQQTPEEYLHYQANLHKYQLRPRRPQYSEQESRPPRYQVKQYADEQQPQYSHIELAFQPPEVIRRYHHHPGAAVSYRQDLRDSHVRYYRNLERPSSFIHHE